MYAPYIWYQFQGWIILKTFRNVWVLFIRCALKIIVGNIPVCTQVPSVGGLQVRLIGITYIGYVQHEYQD
ncbi:hypothetical protein KQX54_009571 [Cotesia glomerata]|uniref:Uncharacterized protein n=1 Tax=Cotesia glomerata TaxID=32391 RepID=A0AAV7HUQ3_COTGL|nr:hypothetical protein KQX54_009571 [Cotesia glomerata]